MIARVLESRLPLLRRRQFSDNHFVLATGQNLHDDCRVVDSLVPAISNVSLNAFAKAGIESARSWKNWDAPLRYGSRRSSVEDESSRRKDGSDGRLVGRTSVDVSFAPPRGTPQRRYRD